MEREEGVVPIEPLQDAGFVANPNVVGLGGSIPNKREALGMQTGPAQEQSQGRPWS